jgi:hypothetical protein
MRTRYFTLFLLFVLFTGCATRPDAKIEKNPFLLPYVEQLEMSTSPADLKRIKTMAKSELILLHMDYGLWIRNKWIHGRGDPQLLRFFHNNGIDDPDDMSMVIIYALWDDLNRKMSPTERAPVEAKRALVARRRSSYETLEAQCEAQLAKAQNEFDDCYKRHGLPSKNPVNRDPFFGLLVGKDGHVQQINFFNGASPELKECLQEIIQQFSFSEFRDDEVVTLYIVEFPHCRVAERDTLHDHE